MNWFMFIILNNIHECHVSWLIAVLLLKIIKIY